MWRMGFGMRSLIAVRVLTLVYKWLILDINRLKKFLGEKAFEDCPFLEKFSNNFKEID